jgi:hypothetical protein
MLGAFFDGSKPGHDNGRYVMAGFVAFCATWVDIAERWKSVLDEAPPIPKFKMALARDPKWRKSIGITAPEMAVKIEKLSLLVQPPQTLFSVICSISDPQFREIIDETKIRGNKLIRSVFGKHAFNTAYAMLFNNVVARTLWKVHELGIAGDQVDFVFDRENELFDGASGILRMVRRGLPKEIRPMLGDVTQRDEDDVLPLQAADLIAARAKDQCNNATNPSHIRAIRSLAGSGEMNTSLHLREKHIRDHVKGLLKPIPPGYAPPEDWDVAP